MKFSAALDRVRTDYVGACVYGEPYQTPDGATVISVSRVRGRGGDGRDPIASPVGVFVIRGDNVRWVAAVDGNRVALIGVTTGLLAAVISSLAVLRRPPWPNLRGATR